MPYVQQQLSIFLSKQLSATLKSDLRIEKVYIGFLNRIVIEGLELNDLSGKEMLKVTRLSAKFDILPLFKKQISISNIQLFGFNAALEKQTPESLPNYHFILDALASQDTTKRNDDLHLRINSLLIRRGEISYDVRSEKKTPGKFNPDHLHFNNIIATISLKALQKDSINAFIKRFSVEEKNSGFQLKKLELRLIGNEEGVVADNFFIELPHSSIQTDSIYIRYDSLEALKDPMRNLRFSIHMQPSVVVMKDFAPLLPAFASFNDPLRVEIAANGTIDQLNCPLFAVSSLHNHFYLRGDVSLQDLSHPIDSYVFANLSRLYIDRVGIDFLVHNLNKNATKVPFILNNLGTISFNGELSGYFTDLVTYGKLRTDLGELNTDVKITSNKEESYVAYSGRVNTENFDLGTMLSNPKLGKIVFNMDVNGNHRQHQYPQVFLKGLISSIDYSQYTYENITLDGAYKDGGFSGKMAMDDNNGSFFFFFIINTTGQTPTFNFLATFDHVRPYDLHLTSNYEGAEFSARLRADFTGGSIDEMDGEINLDSLTFTAPEKHYFLDNLKITASNKNEKGKTLNISSKFIEGNISGDYSYRTLPTSFFNLMQWYMPALLPDKKEKKEKKQKSKNNFHFDLHIYDTDLISTIFDIPIKIYTHSTVKGYFNDESNRLRIEGYFPRMRYKTKFIESAMLLCENPHNQIRTSLRFTNRRNSDAINIAVEASAQNDSIQTVLNWGNSSGITYSGQLSALACLISKHPTEIPNKQSLHTEKAPLKTIIHIRPTEIILNDTLWEIHPSEVVIDSGKIQINAFNFAHKERYLSINGTISHSLEDTVRVDLEDINIGYVFDIANLGINFQGEATGTAFASGVLEKPIMSTELFIRNLGLNEGLLGDAQIHGEWHHDVKGIYLNAQIREKDKALTHVDGFIYPVKPTSALDLQIKAHGTNLKFIHHYMRNVTSEFKGRVWGDVHFYGRFKALTMEGQVQSDASFKVDVLNTTYLIKDSILIKPDGLIFNNNRVFDTQGHEGRANGYLHYQHFKNLEYRFNFNVNNMLVMNTSESPDFPFYGTVYATGNATIAGNMNEGLNINVAMTTNSNSVFTYIKDNVSSAVSNQFIKFVDKTPRRTIHETILSDYEMAQLEIKAEEEKEEDTDIHLNLLIDATPDATMKIIMDPMTGDYISGKGAGSIRTEFFNKGDVKMFGSYKIDQGVYKFSLQEVIRKDFVIEKGSTISFNGSPLDAFLDIKANYIVNSASLNDLIPNANEYVNQTNVKVNCIMAISGQLTAPDIKLDLDLPNEREEVRALVRNYIPTDEQINMQILYLLGIGKFYAPENTGTTDSSDMMSSVLSSTLSGQLNNALANIINNNNWNIGTNLSTGEKGWTDVEFEGMLSGQLLNNRLLINGNFGYRDNPLANTNFVGDFEAEWLVNRSGNIRLKAYNETNDRYYTRTNLTTQGIGIIFKKDFDKWSELFFWNRWKFRRLRKKRIAIEADSLSHDNKNAITTQSK